MENHNRQNSLPFVGGPEGKEGWDYDGVNAEITDTGSWLGLDHAATGDWLGVQGPHIMA